MKTRVMELFGVKYPIVLAALGWISTPEMVASVCNAGALGLYPIGGCTPEEARKAIREIKSLTDKSFGINQLLASPTAQTNIDIAIEEKVPVIEYALGRPWFIKQVHDYGGKIIAKLSLIRHAQRAEQMGVDAVNITGYEAAGHPTEVTSMVLIPLAAKSVKIPIIASGGFCDGHGLAGALMLGADGITMGTRFAMTKESLLNEKWKQVIIKATEADTIYVNTGDPTANIRAFKNKAAENAMKNKLPLLSGISGAFEIKKMLNLSWMELMKSGLSKKKDEEGMTMKGKIQFAASATRSKKVMIDGDDESGILTVGQVIGSINDVPTCQEVITRIMAEAEEAMKQAQPKFA